jgi:ribosomal protein L29
MLRTDTGNFNRFLTSLGLLLLIASLFIPYFYFRDTDVLRTSRQDLRGLTASGRTALEARQARSIHLEVPVLVLAALLASGGVAALFLGGRRLRVAQGKEDAAIDRRARREDYEIRQMSTDEVEEKRNEQVREAVDEEAAGAAVPPGTDATAEAGEAPPPLPVPAEEGGDPPMRLRTFEETRRELARIEEDIRVVLEAEKFDTFIYRSGVKIVPESGPRSADLTPRQVNVDGLFEAKNADRPDVALEIKVTRLSVRSLKPRAKMFTDAVLALLARYNQVTGRGVLGWLVVLVPARAERLSARERHHVERHFDQALAGLARCSVVHEDDLDRLPQIFREIFG